MFVNVLGYQFDDIDDSDILTNHWILTERGNGTLTKDLQAAKAAAPTDRNEPRLHHPLAGLSNRW